MITISGLEFIDNTKDIPFRDRSGAPYILAGVQLAPNHKPLLFEYEATDAVSTFELILISPQKIILNQITLTPGLITSNGSTHYCDGLTEYSVDLTYGLGFFVVNDRYESDVFNLIPTIQGVGYDIIECNLLVY